VEVKALLLLLVFAVSAPAFAQETEPAPPIFRDPTAQFPETAPPHEVLIHPHRQQRDKYIWSTFGPGGIMDATLGATIGQVLHTPKEWDQDKQGYLKRWGTEYAEAAINSTTKYAIARLRDEDPSFRPCGCSGVQRRALHAIISPVVAYDFRDGSPHFSYARMAGTATSSFVSGNTWKPAAPSVGSQFAHVGLDLATAAGVNLLREFIFHHRNPL